MQCIIRNSVVALHVEGSVRVTSGVFLGAVYHPQQRSSTARGRVSNGQVRCNSGCSVTIRNSVVALHVEGSVRVKSGVFLGAVYHPQQRSSAACEGVTIFQTRRLLGAAQCCASISLSSATA